MREIVNALRHQNRAGRQWELLPHDTMLPQTCARAARMRSEVDTSAARPPSVQGLTQNSAPRCHRLRSKKPLRQRSAPIGGGSRPRARGASAANLCAAADQQARTSSARSAGSSSANCQSISNASSSSARIASGRRPRLRPQILVHGDAPFRKQRQVPERANSISRTWARAPPPSCATVP